MYAFLLMNFMNFSKHQKKQRQQQTRALASGLSLQYKINFLAFRNCSEGLNQYAKHLRVLLQLLVNIFNEEPNKLDDTDDQAAES